MGSDWEEVKRLVADFQRTQLSETTQKLSERNCIEIVRKLVKQNKIQVFFTTDGKEYLTPDHLLSEIETELYANNGRIYLYELSSNLLIDISIIEQKATELAKHSSGKISLILGQLITNEYKDQLAIEINEKLQSKGSITIAEIVKFCDLPPDFIQSIVNTRLRSLIDGLQDPNNPQTYFTQSYLDQFQSKIIGVLNAITKPTLVNQIIANYKFPSKIFITIAQELVKDKIKGHFTSFTNGSYIPEVYLKIQIEFTENFLKQNRYIEYDTLNKIRITDPKLFFKKRNDLCFLRTCLIENSIYKQIELEIENVIQDQSWLDLYSISPSVLNVTDFEVIIDLYKSLNKSKEDEFLYFENFIVTKKFLTKLSNEFNVKIKEKAEQELKKGNLANYFDNKEKDTVKTSDNLNLSKKEERKKVSSSKTKSGGGSQGREVKIKSTKKKYNKKDEFEDDDLSFNQSMNKSMNKSINQEKIKFLDLNELISELNKICEKDLPEELVENIAIHLESILDNSYINVAKKLFLASQTVSGSVIKKTHVEMQNSTQVLFYNIIMFNKSLNFISGEFNDQLKKFLCKTLCTELICNLITYASTTEEINLSTTESRTKAIKKLDSSFIEPFNLINQLVANNDIDQFIIDSDKVFEKLDFMIRKLDKRKESSILSENKHNLLNQLNEINNDDYALILHLCVIILFNESYKTMVHASGKFVPQLIRQLQSKIVPATLKLLTDCELLVMKQFKKENNQDDVELLKTLISEIKIVATNLPKEIFV